MSKFVFVLIAFLYATSVKSADSLYIYGANGREYYPIDTSRILIKWGAEPDELGGSGFLTPYPSISTTTWITNKIENLVLHNFTGSYNYQSVVAQLRSDAHVESVNEVLVVNTDENLYLYFGNKISCRFQAGTAQTFVDSICVANHLAIESESQYVPRQYVLKRLVGATLSTRALANYLHDLPLTTWAQPDWTGNGTALGYSVSDEYFHFSQWNIKKTIGYKSTTNYGAWELTRGSAAIRVAVLDEGMEPHEDFDTSKWEPGIDFTPPNGIDYDPSPITPEPPNIIDAHGMAVLGIIAAAHNNPVIVGDEEGGTMYSSTAGMAPLTKIIPLRIIDPEGYLVVGSKVEDALYYAASTADIINCSWGMDPVPFGVQSALTYALTNGRNGKGCIVVASSGNTPMSPMRFPATNDSVIVVGAIGQNDRVLSYSEWGPTLDVLAPSMYACGKNGVTCQDSANSYYTVDRADTIGYNKKDFGNCYPSQDRSYVCTFSGTSASAPAV
ncbi:MAG: S8 family serine peptidase, partial [Candidatus Zixiibacteriota bacterium]